MILQPYNSLWPENFESIKAILQTSISDSNIRIEHIGSTSVIGLAAKPIIDIDLIYPPSVNFLSVKECLEKIGYIHNGDQGIPGREVFKRPGDAGFHKVLDSISHHLYVCSTDSEELKRHILFRNFLRDHEPARIEYQNLKYAIAADSKGDRKIYANLKQIRAREFILSIVEMAKNDIQ
ncbi:MAG: GrpB family protein [Bacteroidia bacterium]